MPQLPFLLLWLLGFIIVFLVLIWLLNTRYWRWRSAWLFVAQALKNPHAAQEIMQFLQADLKDDATNAYWEARLEPFVASAHNDAVGRQLQWFAMPVERVINSVYLCWYLAHHWQAYRRFLHMRRSRGKRQQSR